MIAQNLNESQTQFGPVWMAPLTWAIYWNGRIVDYAHGDRIEANRRYAKHRKARLADTSIDVHQDTPVDELPDTYWKNGHIPPLRLDDEIPFLGEPVAAEPVRECDSYGLEAVA